MELAYAGIHQLCAPVLDQLDALAPPQRDALRVLLGLASAQIPDRFLVGLAVLGLQIGRLARDGLSNPEIGARIFLSPRTVEWHLHNVFAKLGIRSRQRLASVLPGAPSSELLG